MVFPDVPEPTLKEDQVLIEIKAIALNFFDILQVQGKHQAKPSFPFIPGGDRVFGSSLGCFAERIAISCKNVHLIPDHDMSYEEAAGIFVTYPTSYAGLVVRGNLKKAAGGVGIAAVQIAKALGAKVIACCGSNEKLEIAKEYGADYAINYKENKDWYKDVLKITNGHGVDVVYDPVGMIQPSIKCIAWNGRLVVIGFAAGNIEKIPMNLVLLKNISLTGLHWGEYSKHDEQETIQMVWNGIFDLLKKKELKPLIYKKIYYGLENIKVGLNDIASRKTFGKVIVIPHQQSQQIKSKL
ncbi:14980_t:CDS:2 [Entrophospora sp. SA101]|nr:14980_t:CDS:2 [Entrophospora sp. SA101]